jgi:peptide/nickel transport system substrate-binding protein
MQQVLFKVGLGSGPSDLDPHYAWDSPSYYVIDQVCEGLFAYDLSDPENSIIPNLALSGTWNPAGTEYTCILRQGVTFHDGALFNADAVIFTWNRLNWALNVTGTNTDRITQFHQLYELPDGRPIVSSITKNNDYNITFVLNDPYAPFESLLSNVGSYMLSPSSTPATAYIDTITGDLVGTGPFVYDVYIPATEVNFHAFDNYWKGKANITEMRFQIIEDSTTRYNALLMGDVHFIRAIDSDWYSLFKSSPDITFLNTSTTSNSIYYLVMNNHQTNCTLREAISYAIDYDYILNELREGNVKRLKSPIPNGILYANDTFDVPTLNVTRARLVMQSMGFGVGLNVSVEGPDEAAWQASTFFSVNYSYNADNQFRADLGVLIKNNLDLIGIEVIDQPMSWADFIYRAYGYMEPGGYDSLGLFWIGWGADYNDPSNLINTLFSNVSAIGNSAQYDGYQAAIEAGRNPLDVNDNVQLLMEAALSEVDPIAREALYDRIQELLIEEDYPWAWGYVNYLYHAYDQHLTGFQQNSMNKLYFYPCLLNYPILPGLFSIFSDADDTDIDGNFNITWSPSDYADNYSLYVYPSVITEINGSLTLLLDEVTELSYEASGYSDDTYYFLVVAKNGNGNTNSSNLMVNVEIEESEPEPEPFIPGFEMWTMFFTISSVGLILLLRKKKKIT